MTSKTTQPLKVTLHAAWSRQTKPLLNFGYVGIAWVATSSSTVIINNRDQSNITYNDYTINKKCGIAHKWDARDLKTTGADFLMPTILNWEYKYWTKAISKVA